MKKSSGVTLTLLAGVGCALHAQQLSNPCAPASFNASACRAAVKSRAYCDGGTWVPQQYQAYPYYYNLYQAYSSAGGAVFPAPASTCAVRRSGFGAHGAAMQTHS
jgi:hypothetical protein